jgi:nucleotide-binding universal stress UspA family protein
MYKHILVPTDGSKLSLKAAREAAILARSLKARITAVYVTEPYMPPLMSEGMTLTQSLSVHQARHKASMGKAASAALRKVEKEAANANVAFEAVATEDNQPWEGILKTAKQKKCDVIVMASHGRGSLAGALLGSETTKVLSNSKTPVLVCR